MASNPPLPKGYALDEVPALPKGYALDATSVNSGPAPNQSWTDWAKDVGSQAIYGIHRGADRLPGLPQDFLQFADPSGVGIPGLPNSEQTAKWLEQNQAPFPEPKSVTANIVRRASEIAPGAALGGGSLWSILKGAGLSGAGSYGAEKVAENLPSSLRSDKVTQAASFIGGLLPMLEGVPSAVMTASRGAPTAAALNTAKNAAYEAVRQGGHEIPAPVMRNAHANIQQDLTQYGDRVPRVTSLQRQFNDLVPPAPPMVAVRNNRGFLTGYTRAPDTATVPYNDLENIRIQAGEVADSARSSGDRTTYRAANELRRHIDDSYDQVPPVRGGLGVARELAAREFQANEIAKVRMRAEDSLKPENRSVQGVQAILDKNIKKANPTTGEGPLLPLQRQALLDVLHGNVVTRAARYTGGLGTRLLGGLTGLHALGTPGLLASEIIRRGLHGLSEAGTGSRLLRAESVARAGEGVQNRALAQAQDMAQQVLLRKIGILAGSAANRGQR
jgi:hypothetical protein